MPRLKFNLNGKATEASYEPGMHFLEVLREECAIVSPKNGCAPEGICGCCLILVGGTPALSCLRKPAQMEGHDVVTLEGVPDETRRILSEAFVLEGGVQCGFCIPGIMIRASALMQQGRTDDRRAVAKALDGHLCRCTGYGRIIDAIQTAGEACRTGGSLPRREPRWHFFFGEEFGLHRNSAFAKGDGHGIGKSVLRLGGLEQALGDKPFVDDMRVPGMLHGAMALTEHARAKILRIHPEEAAAMPGVVRIFTAADVPGFRGTGLTDPDQPVFVAEGEVTCCVSDFLAMVVADTQFHARQAAKKIRVDYQVLEPITDPFEALKTGAPLVHSVDSFRPTSSNVLQPVTAFSRGKVDAALATAPHVIEAAFQTQPVEIAFLEPEACLVVIVADAGGYHTTSAKCALRAACHSYGAYRVPNVDVEAKAVYTNNPNAGAMRGFGSNQAQFAMEGVMDLLAERVGVDGWDLRERNILNPGDAFGTGQIMRESVRGMRASLEAVKGIYKSAKYKGVGCGIKSTGLGNGTTEGGYIKIRVVGPAFTRSANTSEFRRGLADQPPLKLRRFAEVSTKAEVAEGREGGRGGAGARLEILTGYTEMGQGVFTATLQAVCEETGLPPDIMTVEWDKDLGEKCGETWASRATTLSCAAAQRAARKLAADLKEHALDELVGREYYDECVYNFTTRPGTPEAVLNPTTHLTFSYSTQVVILDDEGRLERVVAAHDVGRAINPRLCAEQMEGGVHMGLGYALSENFTSTNGRPDSLLLRDLGIVRAKHMPKVDVILIEVPDEVGGYGAKGVGEIGCVATAGAVAGALYSYDGIRRYRLPMDDAPAAAPSVPKSRQKSASSTQPAAGRELFS